MTAPLAPDPRWNQILASDLEDEAWQEQQDRLDRLAEYAPAPSTNSAPAVQGQGADAQEASAP